MYTTQWRKRNVGAAVPVTLQHQHWIHLSKPVISFTWASWQIFDESRFCVFPMYCTMCDRISFHFVHTTCAKWVHYIYFLFYFRLRQRWKLGAPKLGLFSHDRQHNDPHMDYRLNVWRSEFCAIWICSPALNVEWHHHSETLIIAALAFGQSFVQFWQPAEFQ